MTPFSQLARETTWFLTLALFLCSAGAEAAPASLLPSPASTSARPVAPASRTVAGSYEALQRELAANTHLPPGQFVLGDTPTAALASLTVAAGQNTTLEPVAAGGTRAFQVHAVPRYWWNEQLRASFSQAVRAGDVLLLTAQARSPQHEAFRGSLHASIDGSPGSRWVRLDGQWRRFFFPTVAGRAYQPGDKGLLLMVGTQLQRVELRDLAIINFGSSVKVDALPDSRFDPILGARTDYEGREANAPWRKAAQERIEKIRKGDLTIRVVDEQGKAVPNAQVQVRMKRHAFAWGSMEFPYYFLPDLPGDGGYNNFARRARLLDLDPQMPGEQRLTDIYNTTLDDPRQPSENELRGSDWLHERGFSLNGFHALGLGFPNEALLDDFRKRGGKDSAEARAWLDEHIRAYVRTYYGHPVLGTRNKRWITVNEIFNPDRTALEDIFGLDKFADWIKEAHALQPQGKFILADINILRDDRTDAEHFYDDFALRMKKLGAPLDILADQGHILTNDALFAPEGLVQRLDDIERKLPGMGVEITEYDLKVEDEPDAGKRAQVESDYTRDYMTALFSHPTVKAFTLFGIMATESWGGAPWRGGNATIIYDQKGLEPQLRPCGRTFLDLVFKKWWTNAQGTTNRNGAYTLRGFKGDYEVTAKRDQFAQTVTARIGDTPTSLTVTLHPVAVASPVLAPVEKAPSREEPAVTLPMSKTLGQIVVSADGLEEGAQVEKGRTFFLSSRVTLPSLAGVRVEYLINGRKIGQSDVAPRFEASWTVSEAGDCVLSARAVNAWTNAIQAQSAPLHLRVRSSP